MTKNDFIEILLKCVGERFDSMQLENNNSLKFAEEEYEIWCKEKSIEKNPTIERIFVSAYSKGHQRAMRSSISLDEDILTLYKLYQNQ